MHARTPVTLAIALSPIVLSLASSPGARAADPPPHGEMILTGRAEKYTPPLTADLGGTLLSFHGLFGGRLESVESYPVDADGTSFDAATSVNVLARVGLTWISMEALDPIILRVDVEGDAVTGPVTEGSALKGAGYPNSEGVDHQMRKASLLVSYRGLVSLIGGLVTSHRGMGLLANDGDHRWTPGSAWFGDPRGGDRSLRAAIAAGPFPEANRFFAAFGWEKLVYDDNLLDGDEGSQFLAAITVAPHEDSEVGFYGVYRTQTTAEGKETAIWAADVFGHVVFPLGETSSLRLETEVAVIAGETELSPTLDHPIHDVLQLGAAFRATLDMGVWGAVLDFLYGSGDQNFDDDTLTAFKTDRNYELGFILFDHAMAAQTARAPYTASDPTLIGEPPEDLDRFPTRGAISNTIALFPRLWVRPIDGLEAYAGPLVAFSNVAYADPYHSRVHGGAPHGPFGGTPGGYLGTEIDLGVRYSALLHGTLLTVALEGGVLIPGDAMVDAGGIPADPVLGGRFMLYYRL